MKTKIGINGFGRIGRVLFRLLHESEDFEVVAINDLADAPTLAHLLKYDSIHRTFSADVKSESGAFFVDGQKVVVTNHRNPEDISWSNAGVELVVESTGLFRKKELAEKHLGGTVRKVVISAPARGENEVPTVVMGINDDLLKGDETIISNASCTTNCAAPMVAVIDELCGVEQGYITTIHSYTSDQRLQDAPHSDLRRARSAPNSIVPTTTGAAKAITKIFPHLDGNMGGCGIRVPVPDGSLTDITFTVKNPKTVEEINAAFKAKSQGALKGYLGYTEDPIVSVDIIGSRYSCLHDAQLTSVMGNMVKVVGWYDNEMGYSARLVDLLRKIAKS